MIYTYALAFSTFLCYPLWVALKYRYYYANNANNANNANKA